MQNDLPPNVKKYAETPIFTQDSVPAKLTSMHDTKPGVWGRLVIIEGTLDYVIEGLTSPVQHLDETCFGIIEPTIRHHITLTGPVKFKVEFFK